MTSSSPWKRIVFRFVFVYIILYILPFPLDGIPKVDAIATYYAELWNQAVPWVGRHILCLPYEITELPGGSGDTTFNYVQLLCFVVIALLVAGVWSIMDYANRSWRPSRPPLTLEGEGTTCGRLSNWLRIYVRFYLGLTLFGYGIAKVINTQFPFPDLDRYIQPVGHLSPMGLLWTFMGYSTPYCVFTGLAECIGGLLLFWRRTATLGALIVAGVMTNVVMLNFCYDVPVKQFSSHLLLFSLFLLSPDIGRLVNFFVLNRATMPKSLGRSFAGRWSSRTALAFKVVFVGLTLFFAVKGAWDFAASQAASPRPALYGLYEVDSFARGGDTVLPGPDVDRRWRRVAVNRSGRLAVQLLDDSVQRYLLKDAPDEAGGSGTLELTPRWEPDKKTTISYRRQGGDMLVLEGDFFGENLQVTLRRMHDPRYLLVDRGFHWINEKPFNR